MVEKKEQEKKNSSEKFVVQNEILGKDFKKKSFLKKIISLIKGFFLIILGFLPSFLFVFLFVQYGSPVSNYLNFIKDIKSSWMAWLSAIIIISLISFVSRIIRLRKDAEQRKKKRFLLALIFFSFFILFVLIGVQSYLYVHYLLRNDVLVRLSLDKQDIFFTDQENEEINFQISVTSNPFCSSKCQYSFVDLSSNKELEVGSFVISSIYPIYKSYSIDNERLLAGSQTLRRFRVSCKSEKTWLCYTSGDESERSILLTVNYNLSLEKLAFKESSKNDLISMWGDIYFTELNLKAVEKNIALINSSFETENFVNDTKKITTLLKEPNFLVGYFKNLWENQSFDLLNQQLSKSKEEVLTLKNDSENLKSFIFSNISHYNSLLANLTSLRARLDHTSKENLSISSCEYLNKAVETFDNFTAFFLENKTLTSKDKIISNLSNEIESIYLNITSSQSGDVPCVLTADLPSITQENISNYSISKEVPKLSFKEKDPICCFDGACEKCCENKCANESYPIIFLHGHSINRKLPADYSLDVFNPIKEKLVLDGGYIDAGAIILSNNSITEGLWGKTHIPMLIAASYFFDTTKTDKGEVTVASTTESIDTYAIRLKSLVELVKSKTGKSKVVIVAHSMGGLVTRRYIQLFGAQNVDKIVLITVPNHGVDDKIKEYCGILGSEIACKEMDKDSTFISDLNNNPFPDVPIYNLIGTGCNMGDETGDGVVKNSSQYLSNAHNYYLEGKCNELSFDFFHGTIMYPDKSPEAYSQLKEILA